MPFYGVSGLEVERFWGYELDKNRMYFRSPLTLSVPTLSLGRDTETRDNEDFSPPNSRLGPSPESTACSLSSPPFRPTDLLSTLPLSLDSI